MKNPIIVALDVPGIEPALKLVEQLSPVVGGFKVGSELFTTDGPEVVHRIRATGADVFLDLKYHDIPNTVAKAVEAAVRLDVQMLTVHTCGGSNMLKAAEEAAQKTAAQLGRTPPLVLGVTVLTSMDTNDLNEVGVHFDVARQVERLANLAVASKLRGLVCSPLEITALREFLPEDFKLVSPGVRVADAAPDDQKRTLTPRQAIDAGADYLVVGRPIYKASNPRAAAEEILASLK